MIHHGRSFQVHPPSRLLPGVADLVFNLSPPAGKPCMTHKSGRRASRGMR